ncbi:MAG: histidine--tRNA ligase [Chloroflexi bacterium]|nr:histidine--tRNA ligase [Chloroflexota bacterium]
MQPVERVRGMLDHAPAQALRLHQLSEQLLDHFLAYGCRRVEVPIIEYAELFQRKLGADINARMYGFTDLGGRRLALRPELTAPVLRAFLDGAASGPLPLRLAYTGPVFRYERPQRGRYRQFTQVGVEIIGADSPLADAELLWMTQEVPRRLGLSSTHLVIGHLGVLIAFLRNLGVDGRTESILLQGLETLKKRGSSGYETLMRVLGLSQQSEAEQRGDRASSVPSPDDPRVQAALTQLPRPEAILLVKSLLGSINTSIGGGRDPEEIVDRLLERLGTGNQQDKAERAVHFIQELSEIAGTRDQALAEAAQLVARYRLPDDSLQELEGICRLLDSFGFDWSATRLDLSLGRGLQYYTGMVFELYGVTGGVEDQLCGGGRYDDLAVALGARQPVRALGCSWGLERLLLATTEAVPGQSPHPDIFIVPIAGAFTYAFEVATVCRQHRFVTEMDCVQRGIGTAIGAALKKGARWILLIGPEEERSRVVTVRDERAQGTRQLALDELRRGGRASLEGLG